MRDDILVTRRLRKEFGGLLAVDDIDFTIPRESTVSLIGPNGAGKTTTLPVLKSVVKATKGRVEVDGETITRRRPHAIQERGIDRQFQNIPPDQQPSAL